jgi:hypothetical protein
VRYKSVNRSFDADTTGDDSKLSYSWDVGSQSKDFEVKVEVTVTYNGEAAKTWLVRLQNKSAYQLLFFYSTFCIVLFVDGQLFGRPHS